MLRPTDPKYREILEAEARIIRRDRPVHKKMIEQTDEVAENAPLVVVKKDLTH